MADGDAEVRAAAARVLGDAGLKAAENALIGLLADPDLRVRSFAALGLGRIGSTACIKPALELLRSNADQDTYLRHAAVMALAGSGDRGLLLSAASDPSSAVRLGVLVALRRLAAPEIARFIDDTDSGVSLEAARAIHDAPIAAALPALAARLSDTKRPELFLYRALNARFRSGGSEDAEAVASFAANEAAPATLRVEALKALGEWAKPPRRDRVTGLTQDLRPRGPSIAVRALKPHIAGVFAGPDVVREQAIKISGTLGIQEVGPTLLALASDQKQTAPARVGALLALAKLESPLLDQAREAALRDPDASVRTEGRRLLAEAKPKDALPLLTRALREEDVAAQQGAYRILGEIRGTDGDELLVAALDRLLKGQLPPQVHLDLIEAAGRRSSEAVQERLARYESTRPAGDHLAHFRETLHGGDARSGQRIFSGRTEVSCLRCHKINGEGGEVGPDLTGVGGRQTREYLLESIVDPNRQITKGFETVVLTLTSGKTVVGIVKSEDASEVRLITAEGQIVSVPKSQIDERQTGKSAMPEDLVKQLSKSDLRDLVEYLAGLKETKPH
jgi:quinoprotein glucose dehydrogenase